eukprot:scaffold133_cov257-Pinguiococcus_pyrenoidosus.AAC.25
MPIHLYKRLRRQEQGRGWWKALARNVFILAPPPREKPRNWSKIFAWRRASALVRVGHRHKRQAPPCIATAFFTWRASWPAGFFSCASAAQLSQRIIARSGPLPPRAAEKA